LELLRLLDEQYARRPFFGNRKMVPFLKEQGHRVNRKRVQRLMRVLGLVGMAPGPNTSRPHQSLGNRTPEDVYATASGGGARIVDKFSKNGAAPCRTDSTA